MSEMSFIGMLKANARRPSESSFKELVENGTVIAGSVDTVIEKLAYYTDTLRAGMLVTGGHTGEMPDYLVLKNQEMMAKEVMPHFRPRPREPAASALEGHDATPNPLGAAR
jgi:hypothetical protein